MLTEGLVLKRQEELWLATLHFGPLLGHDKTCLPAWFLVYWGT